MILLDQIQVVYQPAQSKHLNSAQGKILGRVNEKILTYHGGKITFLKELEVIREPNYRVIIIRRDCRNLDLIDSLFLLGRLS